MAFTGVAAIQLYWIPREPPRSIRVDGTPSAGWKRQGHDDEAGSIAVIDD